MSTSYVQLDDLVVISGGGTPSKAKPEYFTGQIPWVSPKDMKSWDIVDSEDHITEEAIKNSTTKLIAPGAILVVIRSGVLKHSLPIGINKVPVTINQDLKALICSDRIDAKYLARFLQSNARNLLQNVRGTTADNIPTDALRQVQVPLPPLSEQKRIAEILDRAEALRAKRRAALALLDELTQSIFLDMFGDPAEASDSASVTMEEVADFITGFAFKSKEFVLAGESVRLCRGANVLPNRIDWNDVVFWPKDRVAEFEKFQLATSDVIIAMDRPWISSGFKIAQVTADDCPSLLVQRVARLRGRTVTNSFLYQLLKQPAFTRHCKPTETTVPHISPIDIRTFTFSMPSNNALKGFDLRLETIAKMRSSITKSGSLSDQLFASLQHRAFRGDL